MVTELKYLVDLWKRLITHTRRMICLIQNMQKEDPFGLLCSFSIRNSKKSYSQGSPNIKHMMFHLNNNEIYSSQKLTLIDSTA